MAAKAKPATVTVFMDDDDEFTHELASDKDWAILFDDVLEVKSTEGATYYPLGSIKRWTVK